MRYASLMLIKAKKANCSDCACFQRIKKEKKLHMYKYIQASKLVYKQASIYEAVNMPT